MTRTISTIAVAALSLTLASPKAPVQTQQTGPRIAYINSAKIMDGTPGRAELEKPYEKELAPFEARLKALQDSNVDLTTKYQKDAPTLTAEVRTTRLKEIEDKRRAWEAKSITINQQARDRKQELDKPMLDALEKILNDIRTEDGYWMIIDVTASPGLIVSIDRNTEITDRVLDRFKIAVAKLPKPGTVAPPSGSPVNTSTGVGGAKPPPSP